MKHSLYIMAAALLMGMMLPARAADVVTLDGVQYNLDTLEHYKVGPGTWYTSMRLMKTAQTVNRRVNVCFLTIDQTNPYVSMHAVLGRDSIYGGERPTLMAARKSALGKRYFAGTNGGFYATTGNVGLPSNGILSDDELGHTPNTANAVVAFDADGLAHFGAMSFSGKLTIGDTTLSIKRVNHTRGENQLVLYNHYNGHLTHTNQYGTELLMQLSDGQTWGVNKTVKAKVVRIERNVGNMLIPEGCFVLSAHGTKQAVIDSLAKEGMELKVKINLSIGGVKANYRQAIGGDSGYPLPLADGVVETANTWAELHPRTALGQSVTGDTLMMCVVDGRGQSIGCTTRFLAELMLRAGAYNMKNLDGGGSSCMYINKYGQVNTPSDGTERATADGVFAVCSAPDDEVVAGIRPRHDYYRVPRYGIITPGFLGYNQYGMLVDTLVQGVSLSSEVAEVQADGSVVATGAEGGVVNATYQGLTAQFRIVIDNRAEVAIRLDSVLIDNRHHYPVEVQSRIAYSTVSLQPQALTWNSEDPDVAVVNDGVLTGVANGRTRVVGTLGDFSDTLDVKVEIAEQSPLLYENFCEAADWKLTCSSGFNAAFVEEDAAAAFSAPASSASAPASTGEAKIGFTYKATRAPFVKLTRELPLYGLPDTVRLALRTDADLSRVIVGIRPNNAPASGTVATEFDNIATNQDVVLSVPVDQLGGGSDIALYPLLLEYINMNLATTTTAGRHTIVLQGISLCYAGLEVTYLPAHSAASFTVYPNPVDGLLTVSVPAETDLPLALYDLQGRTLRSGRLYGTNATMDLSTLPAGTYLLQVGTETCKIIRN